MVKIGIKVAESNPFNSNQMSRRFTLVGLTLLEMHWDNQRLLVHIQNFQNRIPRPWNWSLVDRICLLSSTVNCISVLTTWGKTTCGCTSLNLWFPLLRPWLTYDNHEIMIILTAIHGTFSLGGPSTHMTTVEMVPARVYNGIVFFTCWLSTQIITTILNAQDERTQLQTPTYTLRFFFSRQVGYNRILPH